MHLYELVDPALLEQELEAKMVRRTTSPDGSKHLYVYTEQAQYKRNWNAATINCRGLVVDSDRQIIARPFPKFFNYGEHPEGSLNLAASVSAFDKLDGSLAVLLPDETLTSKGSFTSHVAEQATKVYQERYAGNWTPEPKLTYCFECIWPDGRIVLDYGETEDLILLGAVDKRTGLTLTPLELSHFSDPWPGPVAEVLADRVPLRDVLDMPPRDNAEGLVIHNHETGDLIKIKQDDYLALHRIVTGTSAITVWEHLAVQSLKGEGVTDPKRLTQGLGIGPDRVQAALDAGPNWEQEMAQRVPDEFHKWLMDTAQALSGRFLSLRLDAEDQANHADHMEFPDRKTAVQWMQQESDDWTVPWQTVLDIYLNNGEPTHRALAAIWKQVRPSGATWGMKGEL